MLGCGCCDHFLTRMQWDNCALVQGADRENPRNYSQSQVNDFSKRHRDKTKLLWISHISNLPRVRFKFLITKWGESSGSNCYDNYIKPWNYILEFGNSADNNKNYINEIFLRAGTFSQNNERESQKN